jgi:membrane protease YdiL (CAAX protease family)
MFDRDTLAGRAAIAGDLVRAVNLAGHAAPPTRVRTPAALRGRHRASAVPWLFVVLLLAAELLTTTARASWLGLILHGTLLASLAAMSSSASTVQERRFLAALMVAPIVRIVSLGLPLWRFPEALWIGVVAFVVMVATLSTIRQLRLPLQSVGLSTAHLPLQLGVGALGLPIGVVGFAFLPQPAWATGLAPPQVLPVAAVIVLAAVIEELAFRGVLLSAADALLGSLSVLFTTIVYAVLQVGHGSVENLALALATGALYANVARRSRSIIGVSIAHALASLVMFVVLPQAWFVDMRLPVVAALIVGMFGYTILHRRSSRPRRARQARPC